MGSKYLPNPCLLGILLTVATHDGPQLVFHYPPVPKEYGFHATPLGKDLGDDNVKEYYSSSSSGEDDGDIYDQSDVDDDTDSHDFTNTSSMSSNRWSGVSGSDMTSSVSPNNNYISGKALLDILDAKDRRRKRKEKKRRVLMKHLLAGGNDSSSVSVDDRSVKTGNNSVVNSGKSVLQEESSSYGVGSGFLTHPDQTNKVFGFDINFLSEIVTPPKKLCNTRFELTVDEMVFLGLPIHVLDNGKWRNSPKPKSSRYKKSDRNSHSHHSHSHHSRATSLDEDEFEVKPLLDSLNDLHFIESEKCPMHMFNLVFVMNPPVVEYNHRVDEMFHYVISRLCLLLRYEQDKHNFVWKEALNIMKLKEETAGLDIVSQWRDIIPQSDLAKLMRDTFESVSNARIVNLTINNKLRSFQIPIKTEFHTLPKEKVIPGSTLSSISPFTKDDSDEVDFKNIVNSDENLAFFTILLLDDPEVIIRDIQVAKESVIARFIRLIRPTKSMSRLATTSGLDLAQIKAFACHLVYWRRAKIIPAINTRNIYVISALAPLDRLEVHSMEFRTKFPSLPVLSKFLSLLSTSSNKPKQISRFIPSKDHRDLYLDAVSWLLKKGYILQLHTFLFLIISKEIKMSVEEELEREGYKGFGNNTQSIARPKTTETDEKLENASVTTDKVSTTSNDKETTDNTFKKDASKTSSSLKVDSQPSSKQIRIILEDDDNEDTILTDPLRTTFIERRWIHKCVEGKSPEVITLFYKLLRYMDGKNALEIFMQKAKVSRQDLKSLLTEVGEHIVVVRHW
ncbi:SEA (Seh1-associated), Npr2/3, and Iml1p complexes subunit [Komagataella phaffii CBS 7435]|uniref:Nitrogen permease regulator 3 n=1 Tax=Komagataella phaffii (strain ATCC 76273 / CBS 7435 / CECT 11047 / NRRL Y-11430 / Wegner 21-1) TaxID=981350 RepID=F2QPH4_KOMPC|nr:GQ67_01780T0 [Komagataella phaffii]AOA66865.1 GQ68_01795T0 [Komagataella phaffii GS115]CAH2447054.1 SEA (Seh1-associated), Npr2/3, and Iml1p complexes subunit [Komagataella phaffii CBS 7435]CCA37302.1 SEA (Seh1-associated), Npr2/3, and Iml1p complexes subunit [Komagataella phaffii CBS 7435]